MAVQSEGAVVQSRNVSSDGLVFTACQKTVPKMYDIGGLTDQLTKIGTETKALHNQ